MNRMPTPRRFLAALFVFGTLAASGLAAQRVTPSVPFVQEESPLLSEPQAAVATGPLDYILGPGDEIVIMALDADEIAGRPVRISSEGTVSFPMVGRIHAAGMTVEELEDEIVSRLKVYIRQPDLAISLSDFQSQPVSVLGAVGSPGIIQLQGRKTLMEVLSLAGGLRQDHGSRITLTRRNEFGAIPLPMVSTAEPGVSVVDVSVETLMNASDTSQNIRILPHDVISVSTADVVYVIGEVNRPGGFTLNEKETLSVLQALALAEGLLPNARAGDARIIRPVPGGAPEEVKVDLAELLRGNISDLTLQPEDILFVPASFARSAFRRTLDAAISAVTGVAIYRRF